MSNNFVTVHTLVKNEARWIWYALQSVLPFVDEILVWDTGSTDSTVDIIKSISNPKIKYKQIGPVDAPGHTRARQLMLQQTTSKWILILDGDEIWWGESIKELIKQAEKHPNTTAFISPFLNCVGDLFHLQPWYNCRYQIGEHQGGFNIRFINSQTPGLTVSNPHGRQEYRDQHQTPLQNLSGNQIKLVDFPYLHLTHLPRSDNKLTDRNTLKRNFKYRFEYGEKLPKEFVFPEVLYLPKPSLIPDPFFHRSLAFSLKSILFDNVRTVKSYFSNFQPAGY